MNWGLIPEVFFDVIARLVPGSLFLVGALAVHFGPKRFAEGLPSALPSANLAALLLFYLHRKRAKDEESSQKGGREEKKAAPPTNPRGGEGSSREFNHSLNSGRK